MSRRSQIEPARHLSVKKKPNQVPTVDPRSDGQRRPIDRPIRTSRSIPVVDLPSNGPPVPNLINLPDRETLRTFLRSTPRVPECPSRETPSGSLPSTPRVPSAQPREHSREHCE